MQNSNLMHSGVFARKWLGCVFAGILFSILSNKCRMKVIVDRICRCICAFIGQFVLCYSDAAVAECFVEQCIFGVRSLLYIFRIVDRVSRGWFPSTINLFSRMS